VSWRPYLLVNTLCSFGAEDKTTFGGATTIGAPVVQMGAGLA